MHLAQLREMKRACMTSLWLADLIGGKLISEKSAPNALFGTRIYICTHVFYQAGGKNGVSKQ